MQGGPVERYRAELARPGFVHDPAQEMAVGELQRLHEELLSRPEPGPLCRAVARLRGDRSGGLPEVRGLYLWGGVGRGKTYLMDLFFEGLPFAARRRTHFHRFMQGVHQELRVLSGRKNPLSLIGEKIAREVRVLCFDEFFVADITDAMLLSGLLEELFARGVTLVLTSNVEPSGLYRDGLQRQRFLPAIALLERHTRVLNVDGGIDHRLRRLEQAELYHFPLDGMADESLARSFSNLAPETGRSDAPIEVLGRTLRARRLAEDVAWFEFAELCEGPRSQNDYIELAREFHAVLLGNVPVLDASRDDAARRLVNLVDEFYDRNVKLVVSAAAPPAGLYTGTRLAFEFQRTASRLTEMQSREYLARAHRP
ncbi:MAG: cell division protein ZapE [Gammaproteobacteria bacterium]